MQRIIDGEVGLYSLRAHRCRRRTALVARWTPDTAREVSPVEESLEAAARERERILNVYFDGGKLKIIPARQRRRLVVLERLASRFDPVRTYTEPEVNAILEQAYPDYAALRRYLVDHGFLDRKTDGSTYWRKA